jgi:hypothetical protein
VVNPVEGKIVLDVSRKYVSMYRCDGTGKVVDEDHFAYPFRIDRTDAVSHVVDIYAVLYDWLNLEINGPSARDGGPPAKKK